MNVETKVVVMWGRDHKPKSTGNPWKLKKARKWLSPQSLNFTP